MSSRASSLARSESPSSMRSRRRSDISLSQSSSSSLGSNSVASSTPSERSGYAVSALEAEEADGSRTALRTTRYRRIGPLESISPSDNGRSTLHFPNPNRSKWSSLRLSYEDTTLGRGEKAALGEVYYTKGGFDFVGCLVGKQTMRRRTDALAIDRAEKAHKRAAAKAAAKKLLRRTSATSSKHSPSSTGTDARADGLEYLGFISEVSGNKDPYKLASVLPLGGLEVPTEASDYRNSTLPTTGMLVYGHWDEMRGGLVARRDFKCFGCIHYICDYEAMVEVRTSAGRVVKLGINQFQDPSKLKRGMLVYKSGDGQKYVARVGT